MARLEAEDDYFAFYSLCQLLFSLFFRVWTWSYFGPGLQGSCGKDLHLAARTIASSGSGRYPLYFPGGSILSIAQRARIHIRLRAMVVLGVFASAAAWGQAKPAPGQATTQQTPQQKSLPVGPQPPHSTHFPILVLGFGNQPNWSVRIGLKGPERFDREGYPPIPLEPAEVTREATPETWTYHAKDSATAAAVVVHLSREACADATNDTLTATPPLGGKYSFKISIDHAQIGSFKGCGRTATDLFPKINNRPDQDDDEAKKKPPVPVSSVTKFQSPIAVAYVNATLQLTFKRGSIVRPIAGIPSIDLSASHDGKKLL